MKIVFMFAYWIFRGVLEGSIWRDPVDIETPLVGYHSWRMLESLAVFMIFIHGEIFWVAFGWWLVAVFFYHRFYHLAKRGRLWPISGVYRFLWWHIRYRAWERLVFEILHLLAGISLIVYHKVA